MNKQLKSIAPLKAGIVLGVLYGFLSLLIVPFFLLGAMLSSRGNSHLPAVFGVGFAIMMPIIYAVAGFILGVIASALYNLIARWTGGLEFEVRDLAPSA